VLLLDEPLSALDAKVRVQLREEIRRLQLSLNITTIFVTHDQEEALSIADRVAVMRAGRIEQCAAPAELYSRPATAFVAEFVGTMNRLPGVVSTAGDRPTVTVIGQTLPVDGPVPDSPEVDVLVRPEAVLVTPDADGPALIADSSFRGASVRLRLRLDDGVEVLSDVPGHDVARFVPGTRASVRLVDRPVLVAPRTEAGGTGATGAPATAAAGRTGGR
jgi:putative spermidine/putrescine transport system ATP-binding protein